ncbi:MAG: hypothetical protein BKP49_05985 [Treponema sp. CETP13]|nr:MAG: hypothetical protein BKP49_05985 [Treponema sp. CETP13]
MKFNSNKIHFLFFFVLFLACPVLLFALPFSDIPESADCRLQLVSDWFQKDITEVLNKPSEFIENECGQKFLVRVEDISTDTLLKAKIIIAPCVQMEGKIIEEDDTQSVSFETWPEKGAGSWVLYRGEDSNQDTIRIYFQNNEQVYLQIKPFGTRTHAELVIFGTKVVTNVTVGLPFENMYTLSLHQIYEITKKLIPWQYVFIPDGRYEGNEQMISIIRKDLPSIIYTKDAAYDEKGNPVFASTGKVREVTDNEKVLTLGSLGFVKWIADGLIEPIIGSGCLIEPLHTPTVIPNNGSLAATVLQDFNIYESLDWIRNLAAATVSARYNNTSLRYDNSGVGVNKLEMPNCPYISKTGYKTDCITALLYVLATTEPDLFYFGAIAEKMPGNKDLHIYKKAVAIFPYFTVDGKFNVVVFENGMEYTLVQFIKDNPSTYIDLVRVKSSLKFIPRL